MAFVNCIFAAGNPLKQIVGCALEKMAEFFKILESQTFNPVICNPGGKIDGIAPGNKIAKRSFNTPHSKEPCEIESYHNAGVRLVFAVV